MNFSGFCKPFYKKGSKKDCALRGIATQAKIAEFFLNTAVKGSADPVLTYDDGTFRKWFTGERPITVEVWTQIINGFNLERYTSDLASTLNDTLTLKIAIEFGIPLKSGEMPDKNVLALAIAQQFLEIARGNGEAENVVAKLYHGAFCFEDFSDYIKKSWDKYSKMKTLLYTSSEHSFYDFFVCNDIRPFPMSFRNLPSNELIEAIESGELDETQIDFEKTLQMGARNRGVIKSVTMKKLADVSRYTLLVGMGGIGKSMMMRHLFLTSNKEYSKTGILPILVILREFNPENTNLRNMIVDSVKRFDPSFSLRHLEDILSTGKCQLLLDGLDEIKFTDINEFLKQLDVLVDQYPDNQIVMSTRRFDSFIKLSRFNIMEMMTFKREQSLQLIDKLEYCPEEPKLKAQFREKLISDYFKSHKEFVNNPLLLTLMLMSYHRFAGIPEKRHLFYEQAYNTLLMRHDSDKLYKRVFHSVNDPSEFTKVFREFCAKSYRKHDYEFDRQKFESYFRSLKSIEWLDNGKMNLENFIYDACHSACLMYEEGQTYHFLHRSFQEYFFADYYSHKDEKTLRKLSNYLRQKQLDPFDDSSAFMMMYDLDPENIERFILYPYLQEVFEGTPTDEQFWKYFCHGYSEWQVGLANEEALKKYNIGNDQTAFFRRIGGYRYNSVIQSQVMHLVSKNCCHSFSSEMLSPLTPDDFDQETLMCFIGNRFEDSSTGHIEMSLFPALIEEKEEIFSPRRSRTNSTIVDEDGKIVVFGYICRFPLQEAVTMPEQHNKILSIWMQKNSPPMEEFFEVKKLYDSFKAKYEHVDEMDDDDF